MKILLDTNILLWIAADTLPKKAEEYILDETNELLFSSASIWEVVIKNGLGRSDFEVDPLSLYTGLIEYGYEQLAITAGHTLLIGNLPKLHNDPFDRVMIAQSISEGIPFLTSDEKLCKYPAHIIHIKK